MKTHFHWTAHSVSGSKKPENDDSWIAFSAGPKGSYLLEKEGEQALDTEDIIFAVSDGMGGGNAGHMASRLILEHISEIIPKTFTAAAMGFHPDYFQLLEEAMEDIHQAINEKGQSNEAYHGMAATLTLAWFTPENLYVAHIGDSRLYRHRDGDTELLTKDHNLIWGRMQKGQLSEREYRAHPRRSALYEIIGANRETIQPELAAFPYQKGDRYMLCSDGIVDGLWEKHIHAAFVRNMDSTSSLSESLITRAVTNAGTDDTTLITLELR